MCEGNASLLHQGIPSIQPGRELCLESNQTDINAAKPYGRRSETRVTTSQDMPLPPSPICGGRGERRIWGLAAGVRFASLQAPKGEGAQPGSCRMGETRLCQPWCWDEMLGKPKLAASPAEVKAISARGGSATALAQPRWLRAQNIQHPTISDPQINSGPSLMPTGQSPGPCVSIDILVEGHLPLGQILLMRSKLVCVLWDDLIHHSARSGKVAVLASHGAVYPSPQDFEAGAWMHPSLPHQQHPFPRMVAQEQCSGWGLGLHQPQSTHCTEKERYAVTWLCV